MSRRGREAAVSPITASPCRMSASSFASRRSTALVWPQAAHRSVSGPNHLGSALGHIRAVGAQPGCPCHHDPRPEHSISTAKAPAKEERASRRASRAIRRVGRRAPGPAATRPTLGVSISPHLFRDAAATSLARLSPQDAQLIRALLGHQSFGIAERHYIQANMIEAGRTYQAVIEQLKGRVTNDACVDLCPFLDADAARGDRRVDESNDPGPARPDRSSLKPTHRLSVSAPKTLLQWCGPQSPRGQSLPARPSVPRRGRALAVRRRRARTTPRPKHQPRGNGRRPSTRDRAGPSRAAPRPPSNAAPGSS